MLNKAGWYGGSPQIALAALGSEVMDVYYYELFCREYQATELELNKPKEQK